MLLLAQLISPPLQDGPVRLPGSGLQEERPGKPLNEPKLEIQQKESPQTQPGKNAPGTDKERVYFNKIPAIQGRIPYGNLKIIEILRNCSEVINPAERLNTCAAALTAQLVNDGYINTRVYVKSTAGTGVLEVIEGRIVEIRAEGKDDWLNRQVLRLLKPLRGRVLRIPSVEADLRLLSQRPGVASIRGNLSRLGSDPSQAILTLRVNPGKQPWQGDFSIRNDGTNGSGEARALATLLKPDLAARGDVLLLFGELDSTDQPKLGAVINSASYTIPIGDAFNFTGAFGYSRRNLVELPTPLDGFSSSQYQGLGQLEWVAQDSLRQRWSLSATFSGNRSNTYLNDTVLPSIIPASVRSPSNGYLKLALNGAGRTNRLAWSGSAFFLQGVPAATPSDQRNELALAGINVGSANALGALASANWTLAPAWQLRLLAAGQVAFNPLTSPMRFVLGSDTGLKGLPGQLVSGDSGWLGTAELAWTFWQKKNHALQLVPYIGAGGVNTALPSGFSFDDTVGSGGVLARWLAGRNWVLELGWVEQFQTNDNLGAWQDWALAQGLYAKVQFRF